MKRLLYLLTMAGVAIAISIVACKKGADERLSSEAIVAGVRSWFTTEMRIYYPGARTESILSGNGAEKLLWEHAFVYMSGKDSIFQIPYLTKTKGLSINTSGTPLTLPASLKDIGAKTFLIVRKKEGYPNAYTVMTVKADVNNSSNRVFLYGNNNVDFSGYVFYNTWDGELKLGWRFDDGKVTRQISPKQPVASIENGREQYVNCVTTLIEYFCQNCTTWTFSNNDFVYDNCGPTYVCNTELITTCTYTTEDPGTGGGEGGTDPDINASYGIGNNGPLCPHININFKVNGNSYVANMSHTEARFLHLSSGYMIELLMGTTCITIPNYNNSPITASEKFSEAYNYAYSIVLRRLNNGTLSPYNNALVKAEFKSALNVKLSGLVPGAVWNSSACQGAGIPTTEAKYVGYNECNVNP